jgi:glycosyltransferase involved in cell wall biosynthesis
MAEVHAAENRSWPSFFRLRSELRARRFDVLHVQYPSIGFRYSMLPHLAAWSGIAPATCVTLHEYTRLPNVQRWSTRLFQLTADSVVFTTDEERSRFGSGQRTRVIAIGSNLPAVLRTSDDSRTVVYFGQIRPDKGLEVFLDLARLSASTGRDYEFVVLGACLPRHEKYLQSIQLRSTVNVSWRLGQPLEVVAKSMANALAAYLPFPDGATFRRGSLLGGLVNGVPVISTVAETTPAQLRKVLLAASSTDQALNHLDALSKLPDVLAASRHCSRQLGAQFSWKEIAGEHVALYRQLNLSAAEWQRDSSRKTILETSKETD